MIDAHFHLWQLARADYGWITPELVPLYRDFAVADYSDAIGDLAVEQAILVQCAPTEAETDFLLGITQAASAAGNRATIAGVVGWTDFEAPDAADRIAGLSQREHLLGLRPMIQNIADPDWMLKESLRPAFASMIENDLCFDALVLPRHLSNLRIVLDRYPELTVVVDHGAKPLILAGQLEPWCSQMIEIGKKENVFCKFSGLVTEIGADWNVAALQPWVDALIEAFGVERLIWGSDWPVVNMVADYQSWFACAQTLTEALGPEAQDSIFGLNAKRCYGLQ